MCDLINLQHNYILKLRKKFILVNIKICLKTNCSIFQKSDIIYIYIIFMNSNTLPYEKDQVISNTNLIVMDIIILINLTFVQFICAKNQERNFRSFFSKTLTYNIVGGKHMVSNIVHISRRICLACSLPSEYTAINFLLVIDEKINAAKRRRNRGRRCK